MVDEIGYVVVVFFIIGLTYGLVKQVQHTLTIQKFDKTDSLLGFLISYLLNVFVALQMN